MWICRWVQFVSENEKPYGSTSGKIKILEKSWMYLMVDFITKLPLVAGENAILVVCHRLSKITCFVAITEEISAERLARLFRDNV